MSGPAGDPVTTTERFGRLFRHFPVAVSAGAMAQAWARQHGAPHGATVLVDHEITALGRLGQPWETPAPSTLVFAVVLRPPLSADDADAAWLIGGLAVAGGIDAITTGPVATWWPDKVVEATTGQVLGAINAEVQLAPGRIRAAVITARIDLGALGLDGSQREQLLAGILDSLDRAGANLEDDTSALAAAYQGRCALIGARVKVRLRPTGETRGEATGVDSRGRLQLTSTTGMVERITVDMLRELEIV